MNRLVTAAVLGLSSAAMLSTSASAQSELFAGRYIIQSDDLNTGAPVRTFSGYADSRRLANGNYDISLLIIQYDQTNGNEDQGLAVQSCIGRPSTRDLTITCSVQASSFDSYSPDNFVIRPDGGPDLWSGEITSSRNTRITFISIDAAFALSEND